MKLKQFSAFILLYSKSDALRYAVSQRLSGQPRELCRDINAWKIVLEQNKYLLGDPTAKVLIVDNGFLCETASFLICAASLKIKVLANIAWINSSGHKNKVDALRLNRKEFEAAQANAESVISNLGIFFEEDALGYIFNFPMHCCAAKCTDTEKGLCSIEEKYDLLISRNNSLVLNFSAHDRFLKACYDATADNGKLFFGSKENIANSVVFSNLKQPFKHLQYFEKYA